jgi:hypothetical protein
MKRNETKIINGQLAVLDVRRSRVLLSASAIPTAALSHCPRPVSCHPPLGRAWHPSRLVKQRRRGLCLAGGLVHCRPPFIARACQCREASALTRFFDTASISAADVRFYLLLWHNGNCVCGRIVGVAR